MGTLFVENMPKSYLLFAFSPTKLLATSTRFTASVLKKYPLSYKVVKIQTFQQLSYISDLFYLTLLNV